VRLVAHGLDVALDVIPVPAEGFAKVDDHVNLNRAVATGQLRLVSLRLRAGTAVGKADDRADEDSGALQQFGGALHRAGLDAHGSHAIFRGEFAALLEITIRHRGVQEGMIDHLSEFFVGIFHGSQRFMFDDYRD